MHSLSLLVVTVLKRLESEMRPLNIDCGMFRVNLLSPWLTVQFYM